MYLNVCPVDRKGPELASSVSEAEDDVEVRDESSARVTILPHHCACCDALPHLLREMTVITITILIKDVLTFISLGIVFRFI